MKKDWRPAGESGLGAACDIPLTDGIDLTRVNQRPWRSGRNPSTMKPNFFAGILCKGWNDGIPLRADYPIPTVSSRCFFRYGMNGVPPVPTSFGFAWLALPCL